MDSPVDELSIISEMPKKPSDRLYYAFMVAGGGTLIEDLGEVTVLEKRVRLRIRRLDHAALKGCLAWLRSIESVEDNSIRCLEVHTSREKAASKAFERKSVIAWARYYCDPPSLCFCNEPQVYIFGCSGLAPVDSKGELLPLAVLDTIFDHLLYTPSCNG